MNDTWLQSNLQDKILNRGSVPQTRPIVLSREPMDPQLAAHLEGIRTLLGEWTEPVLLAFGTYTREPEQNASLEKLLQVCCEAALQLTHAGGAAIAVLEEARFIYRGSVGDAACLIRAAIALDSAFPAACAKTRQAFLSKRVSTDSRVDPALRRCGIESLLAVPLLKGGNALGYFVVCSRNENSLNVRPIISLQFIADMLGGALWELQRSKRDKPSPDYPPVLNAEASTTRHSESSANKASFSSNAELAVKACHAASLVNQVTSAVPETTSPPKNPGSDAWQPAASSTNPPAKPVEPKSNEPSDEVAAGRSTSVAERRRRPRTPVDCLAYVSLGEDNGGMLLDINDAGFSIQTALRLDLGGPRQRRARFTGNRDLEADCELVWEQGGQAGFRFSNLSADLQVKVQAWLVENAITPLSELGTVPQHGRKQMAVSVLAAVDELRSMLLNSKFTK